MNAVHRSGSPEEVGMSGQRVKHIADMAEGWVNQGIMPALVILAARRGVIVIHEAFGREDVQPLELDTIFRLSSLTKPITATAIMILVEDGLLSLGHPVSRYIPEFTGEGKDAVMIYHLLTHTSGMYEEDADKHADEKKEKTQIPPPDGTQPSALTHEHLFLRYDTPLRKTPGLEMSYCSYGYKLLGEIVRRVSGMNLGDFASDRIFNPLGMRDTYYITPDRLRQRFVRRPPDAPYPHLEGRGSQETYYASGGASSTAMDIAIFGQMFLNNGIYGDSRILSPASVNAMTRNQIPGISARWGNEFFPEASWGLGWNVFGNKVAKGNGVLRSPKAYGHGGLGGVFMWIDPVYELVGVYFSIAVSESCKDLFMDSITAAIMDE